MVGKQLYTVVHWSDFPSDAERPDPHYIMVDESIRVSSGKYNRPDLYIISAVQVAGASRHEVHENAQQLRDELVAAASRASDKPFPYWHTTEQLKDPAGRRAAQTMCDSIADLCEMHVGVAALPPANSPRMRQHYVQARAEAFRAALREFTTPTGLVIADAIRPGDRMTAQTARDLMNSDARTVIKGRASPEYPAITRTTKILHTSQSADPRLWAADLTAAAASRALRGDWRYMDHLTDSPRALVRAVDPAGRAIWGAELRVHAQRERARSTGAGTRRPSPQAGLDAQSRRLTESLGAALRLPSEPPPPVASLWRSGRSPAGRSRG